MLLLMQIITSMIRDSGRTPSQVAQVFINIETGDSSIDEMISEYGFDPLTQHQYNRLYAKLPRWNEVLEIVKYQLKDITDECA